MIRCVDDLANEPRIAELVQLLRNVGADYGELYQKVLRGFFNEIDLRNNNYSDEYYFKYVEYVLACKYLVYALWKYFKDTSVVSDKDDCDVFFTKIITRYSINNKVFFLDALTFDEFHSLYLDTLDIYKAYVYLCKYPLMRMTDDGVLLVELYNLSPQVLEEFLKRC